MDGSKYVPSNTPIILRPTLPLNLSSVQKNLVITGTLTGSHTATAMLSDDRRTMIFTTTDPFESGERVSIHLGTGITATNGSEFAPISFSFDVQDNEPADQSPFLETSSDAGETSVLAVDAPTYPAHHQLHALSNDTVRVGFDSLFIDVNNSPSPGYLFLATFNLRAFGLDTGGEGAYRVILDKNGDSVYKQPATDHIDWDFKPQPNGMMTYFELPRNKWFAIDSNYKMVDSFWVQPPYLADLHDFELLTHGHALMLATYPIKPYDLSKYPGKGGSDTATFIGGVIEETDSLKNPIWIWRSWDPGHYSDTDATNDLLTEKPFDACHLNAVSVDTDGNILLSARELDEVTKISRKDGHIIWRLGGKQHQFTFVNDSIHFSHQHAVRRIANGHITLFDNGNFGHIGSHVDTIFDSSVGPPLYYYLDTVAITSFARACEYDVNTNNMTANLVWYYSDDSTIGSTAMGYVQRLPNGNTLITWGINPKGAATGLPSPAITEVTPDKRVTFQMDVGAPYEIYRAFKYPSPKYDTGFVFPASPDTLLPSGVASESPTPNSPSLGSPFPNPSNSSTIVSIGAAPADRLELDLYDPLGRHLNTLFAGKANTPAFSLEISTADLANGAYELVLHGEGGTVSRQLIVLR